MRTLFFIASIFVLQIFHITQGQQCEYPSQWMCENGRCISIKGICDGIDHCGDNSDEGGESGICPKCPSGYFKCDNGRCISSVLVCNGYANCVDGSDETEYTCPCSKEEMRCKTTPGTTSPGACIPPEWICDEDGIWDCPLGDDQTNCEVKEPKVG